MGTDMVEVYRSGAGRGGATARGANYRPFARFGTLEFYRAVPPPWRATVRTITRMFTLPRLVAGLPLVLLVAGCATTAPAPEPRAPTPPAVPSAPPLPRTAEPPPPPVNLSGFPLPYRQGYADGCASATGPQRRDAQRYGQDANYRTGWLDGASLCKKR